MQTNNEATGIFGVPIDPETGTPLELEEHEHFYVCAACGQAVDKRDLGQVFHHEEAGHASLNLDA
jgi:hypothetical protein